MRALQLTAVALVVFLTVLPGSARACMSYNFVRGIAFAPAPSQIDDDMIVLDVAFDEALGDGGSMDSRLVTARVRKVLQGHYDGDTIAVGLWGSDCDWPFVFGHEGAVAGHMVTPEQGQATLRPRNVVIMGQAVTETIKWPFDETALIPVTETVDDRRERTGEALEPPF